MADDNVVYQDETAIVSTGQTKDERPAHDVLGKMAQGTPLADLFDHYMTLIYVIDCSFSMDAKLEGSTERKIDSVRGAIKKFAEKRFQRFPDAQVGVYIFGTEAKVLCHAGTGKDAVLEAVNRLDSDQGGTNIAQAVELGVSMIKAAPSRVGAHHIVLVTDGEDWSAGEKVEAMLGNLQKLNIVLDFIYIGTSNESDHGLGVTDSVKRLKGVCSQTGGEYFEVTKSSDFEEKFFQVSNRRALPPARL